MDNSNHNKGGNNIKKTQVYLKGTKESYLNVLYFIPEIEPKGVVHILHGMGEHSGRYSHFAEFLQGQGYVVFAHDHRGHGKSLRAHQEVGIFFKSDTFSALIDDVDIVRQHIITKYSNLPYTMLGHSMGSIILRRYLQRYGPTIDKAIIMGTLPIYSMAYTKLMRGFVFCAGLFKSPNKRFPFIFQLINKGLIDKIPIAKTSFDWISQDETIVQAYIDDPLSGYVYNKRFYSEFFKTIDEVNQLSNIKRTPNIPTLIISGVFDPIGGFMKHIEKVAEVYRKHLPELPLTLNGVEEARHEVLNELNKEETYRYILSFIE